MNAHPLPIHDALPRALVPLAALAAMAVFAARDLAPAGPDEGLYLALLAAAGLLAAGFLAPAPAFEMGAGAALATLAAWALPPGPGRGATMVLLLAAALAVAAARRLSQVLPALPLDATIPLALGLQVLLRGDLLFQLQPSPRPLVALLALPVAGAAAVSVLAGRDRGGPALVAAGTALLLAPGWNVATTLGLIALAAGALLTKPGFGRLAKAAAGIVLVAPIAWEPGPGIAAAIAGLALWRPRIAAALALPAAIGLPLFFRGSLDLPEAVWLLPLLVPGCLLALIPLAPLSRMERGESGLAAATALLLVFGTPLIPDASALTAPLALAALSLKAFPLSRKDGRGWERGPGGEGLPPQTVWTSSLLASTALLAAYPWLRQEPLREALGLFGLSPGPLAAAAVAAAFLAIAAAGRMLRRAWLLPGLAAGAAFLAVLAHLPGPGVSLLPPETSTALDPARPAWEARLPPRLPESVVVESSLSNGAGLANGSPVAILYLDGESRILRAGEETGEWAARRPDVERSAALVSPPSWISWISEDFFAQRYRARWTIDSPGLLERVRIERAPGLPSEVTLAVHQVEVRARSFLPAAGDPLHGTLAVLPLVLIGFGAIHRWTVRLGGDRLSSGGTAAELAALGILVLLALARPSLGLARSEMVLAAGFFLVLAHRVFRQVMAMRPLLGERLPGRPSFLFFALPFVAYLAILPWSTGQRQPDGDEPYYLLITHSLAYDFDAELTNNYAAGHWRYFMSRPIQPQPGDPVGPRGELYSRHNELLPMALAPAYLLGGKAGALATMATLTAALAWMTLRIARRYYPERPGETLAAYALTAFTPPLLLYSHQVWVEVPAALLLMTGLDRILALDGQKEWRWKEWLAIGLSILLLPLLKMRFLLVAGPLLALAWWHAGKPRRPVLILTLLLAALAGGMLLYNQVLYSNPLKIHTWEEVDPYRRSPVAYLTGGLGLFYDAAFGLFSYAPVWLLLLPALVLLFAKRLGGRAPVAHAAVLTFPYLLIVAPRAEWYGGWSPPFRYALIALPLLGLTLTPLLARRRGPGARALIGGLGALTLALAILWIAMPGWTYNFADGRTYALDALSQRTGFDVARLFPSSVRPRSATWVWPPLTLLLVPLLWWLPGRRNPSGRAGAGLAGVAAALAAAAVLPLAAARLPSQVVELEDPQVWKSGGHLHPDRWVIERVRYRGGWVLRVGERLEVPVKAGGGRVRIRLHAQLIRNQPVPFSLDLKAGDRLLAVWQPGRERVWKAVVLGPVSWPEGQPLTLVAHGPHPPGALNGVILDRVELEWL